MNDNDNALNTRLNGETQILIEMVMVEKKAMEEIEEALLETLKEIINSMKTQLENERQERQNNQDYLISLLEDMCNKIDTISDDI